MFHGELYQSFLNARFSTSNAFLIGLIVSFIAVAAFEIVFFIIFIKRERVKNFRQFFKIEHLDVKGIWICVGLGLGLQILNGVFLWNLVLRPVHDFLASHGLGGAVIGLGSGNVVPQLSPVQAAILTIFLIVFWWLEVPEELFFRGYLQNQFQSISGKNQAIIISAIIWALAHVFSLVNVLETFLYGLVYGIVFRLRRNTTPTMIVHSVSNRSLLLAVVIPQIWGITISPNSNVGLLLLAGVYAVFLVLGIGLWRALRLDQK